MAKAERVAHGGDEVVEAARERLRLAAERQTYSREDPMSMKARILALRVEIARLRVKGATWADIARELSGTVDAKADTIRQVMLGLKKKRATKKTGSRPSPEAKQAEKQTTIREKSGEKSTGHDNLSREY